MDAAVNLPAGWAVADLGTVEIQHGDWKDAETRLSPSSLDI